MTPVLDNPKSRVADGNSEAAIGATAKALGERDWPDERS